MADVQPSPASLSTVQPRPMSSIVHSISSALIADDSRSVRELLAATLLENGVPQVFQAADGNEALQLLVKYQQKIDIIFCDLEMPGMDGADLLRRIALAGREIAIVVFSGLDSRLMTTVADMAAGLGLQVLGVLGKPFSENEIRSLLDSYLKSRQQNSTARCAMLSKGELELALQNDQVEVYYQPKACLSDGRIVGVEALARMRDEHLGVLGPATFIQAAEDSGLIDQLTQVVLTKALEQSARWRQQGMPLSVAVNLSPSTLRRLELTDQITALADRLGVPHDQLICELTEDQMNFDPSMLHSVSRLRLKGFRLSVDDFGTGDSGLYRLKSLPFTELKIDRGFLAQAAHREDLRSVLETSIDLGHRLRLSVVAEGVESWEQWEFLKKVRCDQAQGFLISPPMPAAAIPDVIARWQARLQQKHGPLH